MELVIHLPDEFEDHFKTDAFQDSLARIKHDIFCTGYLSGRYERELIDALKVAFKEASYLIKDCSEKEAAKLADKNAKMAKKTKTEE